MPGDNFAIGRYVKTTTTLTPIDACVTALTLDDTLCHLSADGTGNHLVFACTVSVDGYMAGSDIPEMFQLSLPGGGPFGANVGFVTIQKVDGGDALPFTGKTWVYISGSPAQSMTVAFTPDTSSQATYALTIEVFYRKIDYQIVV